MYPLPAEHCHPYSQEAWLLELPRQLPPLGRQSTAAQLWKDACRQRRRWLQGRPGHCVCLRDRHPQLPEHQTRPRQVEDWAQYRHCALPDQKTRAAEFRRERPELHEGQHSSNTCRQPPASARSSHDPSISSSLPAACPWRIPISTACTPPSDMLQCLCHPLPWLPCRRVAHVSAALPRCMRAAHLSIGPQSCILTGWQLPHQRYQPVHLFTPAPSSLPQPALHTPGARFLSYGTPTDS